VDIEQNSSYGLTSGILYLLFGVSGERRQFIKALYS